MPSVSYRRWRTVRRAALDEVETALNAIGGSGRGRRLVTQQVNRAYVVLLSAEFQAFCRDLHLECLEHVVSLVPTAIQDITRKQYMFNRLLDRGNPNPGNLGADFGRFGLKYWGELERAEPRVPDWRRVLERLNEWRNAIAHNDYDPSRLGGTIVLRVRRVRAWRAACDRLARVSDLVLGRYLEQVTGTKPW